MNTIEEAARRVVHEWATRPHSVIATGLRRAIEALQQAIDAGDAARGLQAAHTQRQIDHEAWARVINGHDKPEV